MSRCDHYILKKTSEKSSLFRGYLILFFLPFHQDKGRYSSKTYRQHDCKPCIRQRKIHRIYTVKSKDDIRDLQDNRNDSQSPHDDIQII